MQKQELAVFAEFN